VLIFFFRYVIILIDQMLVLSDEQRDMISVPSDLPWYTLWVVIAGQSGLGLDFESFVPFSLSH